MNTSKDHLADVLFALMSIEGMDMSEVECMFDALLEYHKYGFSSDTDREAFYDSVNRKDVDRTIIKNGIAKVIVKL